MVKSSDLLKKLPPKWDSMLYDHFQGRFSKSHIRNIISGHRQNIEILEAAIDIAQKHKERIKEISSRLNSLIAHI